MNDLATPDRYGTLIEPATLKIQRILPGPVERVWDYLTRSDLRRQWLASGEMDLKVGASFEFVWRNDELSQSPASKPAGFPEEQRMESRITELDPPHRISFTWSGSGDVSIVLEAMGTEVLLTLVHRRLPDRPTLVMVSAGWHMHLDILDARASGREPAPFWSGWQRLRDEYGQRLPTEAAV